MKIGIITFQLAWNCGAVLQCAALKRKLESWGNEVEVINYLPDYKRYRYVKYQNPFKVAYKNFSQNKKQKKLTRLKKALKASVRVVLNYSSKSGRLKQKNDFAEFNEHFLNLTREYHNLKELQKDPPACDVYISGSDQLWNPNLTNGTPDGAYFLDFGDKQIVKASYAVSVCELDVNKWRSELKALLCNFDYISLRETEMKSDLEDICQKEISVCIDPTFLLDADAYLEFEKTVECPDKYLLVYALDNPGSNDLLFKTVKKLSEKRGLEIMVISGPHKWPYSVRKYSPQDGISPGEFLTYIKNADVVVTNSFHATAFSVIYQKDFYTITTPGRGSRVTELLTNLQLQDRLLTDSDNMLDGTYKTLDYSIVKEKLLKHRLSSEVYLRNVINE